MFISPFPPSRSATFKYADATTLTEASNAGVFQVFDLGSLYDPDYTGVGHQPMYFDQLVTVNGPYRRYRVLSGVVRVKILNASSTVSAICTASLSPYITTPSSRIQAAEKPNCVRKDIMPLGSGGAIADFVIPFTSSVIVGVSKEQFRTEDDYAGSYSSSPSLSAKLIVSIFGLGGNANVYCDYIVEQTAHLFDLGNIGTS